MSVTKFSTDPLTAMQITTSSEDDTRALAAMVAQQCRGGDSILLRGDLGAGKTAFARGFIQALCPGQEDITSPTFTLVQTYVAQDKTAIWHVDLYRVQRSEEIMEIGLEDIWQNGISLIEWPERIQEQLPQDALDIMIDIGDNVTQRNFILSGVDSIWEHRLRVIRQHYDQNG